MPSRENVECNGRCRLMLFPAQYLPLDIEKGETKMASVFGKIEIETEELVKAVNQFTQAVVLQGTLMGMTAENQQRIMENKALAYVEKDFHEAIKDWMETL